MSVIDPAAPNFGERCQSYVDGGTASWPCSLPGGHPGPHVAMEVPASLRARARWTEEEGRSQPTAPVASSQPRDPLLASQSSVPSLCGAPLGRTEDGRDVTCNRPQGHGGTHGYFPGGAHLPPPAPPEEPPAPTPPPALQAPPPAVQERGDPPDPAGSLRTHIEQFGDTVPPSGLRQRPGDQPLPVRNDMPYVHDLLSAFVQQRKALGIERYGVALQPFNGRHVVRDVFEEMVDGASYMQALMIEFESMGRVVREAFALLQAGDGTGVVQKLALLDAYFNR